MPGLQAIRVAREIHDERRRRMDFGSDINRHVLSGERNCKWSRAALTRTESLLIVCHVTSDLPSVFIKDMIENSRT